jgi:hypothetical protein
MIRLAAELGELAVPPLLEDRTQPGLERFEHDCREGFS